MKKVLFIFLVSVMVVGCGQQKSNSDAAVNNTETTTADNETDLENEIRELVSYCYSNNKGNSWSEEGKTCYLWSEEFNKALAHATKVSEESGEECGPIDYDPWTLAQDSDDPHMEISDIVVMNESKAIAYVVVRDMGQEKNIQLPLVKEDSKWFVDDIITKENGQKWSMKESLLNY